MPAGRCCKPSVTAASRPRLTPDEERRLPAATALVLTTLGQLRWASQIRCVLAYEAQWQGRRRDEAVYGGAREPCVASRIVATAQRFNECSRSILPPTDRSRPMKRSKGCSPSEAPTSAPWWRS